MSSRLPRSRPEWVTLCLSSAVLIALITLLVLESTGPAAPAAPTAERVGPSRSIGERSGVDVEVFNDGDMAASNVQVVAEIVRNGEVVETADQTVDFLSGGERVSLTFMFDSDPDRSGTDGETLRIYVSGFADP